MIQEEGYGKLKLGIIQLTFQQSDNCFKGIMWIKLLVLLAALHAVNAGLLAGLANVNAGAMSLRHKSHGCTVHAPVCGGDGETYTNACVARTQGKVSKNNIPPNK